MKMSFFRKIRSTLSNSRQAQRGVANPVFTNDGNEGVAFTPIDETHLKRPYHLDNPQPDPFAEVHQSERQQPRTKLSWLTFGIFTILVLGAITAIVIVIIALRDPTPPAQKNVPLAPVCSSKAEIPLMDNLVINCELNDYKSHIPMITITTPNVGSMPVNRTSVSSVENRTWTFNLSSDLSVQIWGPKMQCDSYGKHQINITFPGKDVFTQYVTIAMSSNLPKVNLTVDRATRCTADDNGTDFIASCATWSGCNISSLNLMPMAGNGDVSDIELPFECKTNYTHVQGWYVNCSGRIDKALHKKITKVQCYPSSGIPETRELMPCNLTDRCTAKETILGKNISIICKFPSIVWKNISISVSYPSPQNETILQLNDTINGWKYTNDTGNITLTGPQARCSSAGIYFIKITDGKESRLQNVTVEIKGYPEVIPANTSKNCTACESHTGCNGHYTLWIEPYNMSLATISQTCDTRYSDFDGWVTSCGITRLNASNVSFKCTLFDNKDIEPDQNITLFC